MFEVKLLFIDIKVDFYIWICLCVSIYLNNKIKDFGNDTLEKNILKSI